MKKIVIIAIIVASVNGYCIHSAVVTAKEPACIVPAKELDASVNTFPSKENIPDDIADYQYVYGTGMPVVCNYY